MPCAMKSPRRRRRRSRSRSPRRRRSRSRSPFAYLGGNHNPFVSLILSGGNCGAVGGTCSLAGGFYPANSIRKANDSITSYLHLTGQQEIIIRGIPADNNCYWHAIIEGCKGTSYAKKTGDTVQELKDKCLKFFTKRIYNEWLDKYYPDVSVRINILLALQVGESDLIIDESKSQEEVEEDIYVEIMRNIQQRTCWVTQPTSRVILMYLGLNIMHLVYSPSSNSFLFQHHDHGDKNQDLLVILNVPNVVSDLNVHDSDIQTILSHPDEYTFPIVDFKNGMPNHYELLGVKRRDKIIHIFKANDLFTRAAIRAYCPTS